MDTHTRTEALRLRLHKYYTGEPCKKGHLMFRYTLTGACGGCIAEYSRQQYLKRKNVRGCRLNVYLEHRDDVRLVQAYATALNLDRKINR